MHLDDGKGKGRGKKRTRGAGVFDVLSSREEVQTAPEVIQDIIKEPMTYEEFERMKVSQGCSSIQARVDWENEKAMPDAVFSKDANGTEVMEVEVERQSIYRNRFIRQRTVQGSDKNNAAPTRSDVDNAQRRLMLGMEQTGRASESTS